MPKEFNVNTYNKAHLRSLAKRAKKVQAIYNRAADEASRIGAGTGWDGHGLFDFDYFPQAKQEIDALMREVGQSLEQNIVQGNNENWRLSNAKNDAMVEHLAGHTDIPRKKLEQWKHPNLDALKAFNGRKIEGMGLSGRVWNLTDQLKNELEMALELGIGEGLSAQELSREVRKYLNEPSRLFRRVRDRDGVLRLSKAAQAYHPGQGVYRSSYKNALRMTATENNIAYRTADSKRWQQLPFINRIAIKTSNNHPVPDICDELAGEYPKDFVFTGWHPWCRCFAVAVLPSMDEFADYGQAIADGTDEDFKFQDDGAQIPQHFIEWVARNKQRIAHASSIPYFLKDNPKYLSAAGYKVPAVQKPMFTGNNPATPATNRKPTAQEIAAARHARRTQEQVQAIKQKWQERQALAARNMALAQRTASLAADYEFIDKTLLNDLIARGQAARAAQEAQAIREKLINPRRGELAIRRIERAALAANLNKRQMNVIGKHLDEGRYYTKKFGFGENSFSITSAQKYLDKYTLAAQKTTATAATATATTAASTVAGYVKTQAAKDYEAKKAKWPYKENYHFERKEKRKLRDGNEYECDIYSTPGGTTIVKPKSLPKTYHITVKDAANQLESLPVELKAQTKEICLSDFYNPDDAYWKKKYKNFTSSYATGGDGTVTFYKSANTSRAWAKKDLPFTLSHENGHNLDKYLKRVNGTSTVFSETKEWKDAMAADYKLSKKKSMRSYGENSEHEDFADSFGYFVSKNDWFKKTFPNRYAIISRLLGQTS